MLEKFIVVFKYSKEQIWKQITTATAWIIDNVLLCLNIAKNKSESKSQPVNQLIAGSYVVFKYSKEQIWKQITTFMVRVALLTLLCLNIAKNKSESKSQQRWAEKQLQWVVFKYSKEQIWKQITTPRYQCLNTFQLCLNIAKNKSESKSQRYLQQVITVISCV